MLRLKLDEAEKDRQGRLGIRPRFPGISEVTRLIQRKAPFFHHIHSIFSLVQRSLTLDGRRKKCTKAGGETAFRRNRERYSIVE